MYSFKKIKKIKEIFDSYDEITKRLLFLRGIKSKDEAESFFKKDWVELNEYSKHNDIKKIIKRIEEANIRKEVVGIFSDYDCDGIPSAAALYRCLKMYGIENIVHFTPERNIEGFGINERGIKFMKENNVSLMFTVDCGTSDKELLDSISKEIDIIILDHHIGEKNKIPSVFGIINPLLNNKIKPPYTCAAGCVFALAQALFDSKEELKGQEKWILDLVAMATLSDLVTTKGDNRLFIHYGLIVLRKTKNKGIKALCELSKIYSEDVQIDDVCFYIIPKINAASRMDNANLAYELLTTSSEIRAQEIAEKLDKLNQKRKILSSTTTRSANKIAESKDKNKSIWVLGDRKWSPAIVGLVATSMAKIFKKNVFVWGSINDKIKGSCRGFDLDVFDLMSRNNHLFKEYGGHSGAGGFVLKNEHEFDVEDVLNKGIECNAKELGIEVDFEVLIGDIASVFKAIEKFHPFGFSNENPIIVVKKCEIIDSKTFGKLNNHAKYKFQDPSGIIEGIKFFNKAEPTGLKCDVIANLEYDVFSKKIILKIIEIINI